jgi:hypothetical protein
MKKILAVLLLLASGMTMASDFIGIDVFVSDFLTRTDGYETEKWQIKGFVIYRVDGIGNASEIGRFEYNGIDDIANAQIIAEVDEDATQITICATTIDYKNRESTPCSDSLDLDFEIPGMNSPGSVTATQSYSITISPSN